MPAVALIDDDGEVSLDAVSALLLRFAESPKSPHVRGSLLRARTRVGFMPRQRPPKTPETAPSSPASIIRALLRKNVANCSWMEYPGEPLLTLPYGLRRLRFLGLSNASAYKGEEPGSECPWLAKAKTFPEIHRKLKEFRKRFRKNGGADG